MNKILTLLSLICSLSVFGQTAEDHANNGHEKRRRKPEISKENPDSEKVQEKHFFTNDIKSKDVKRQNIAIQALTGNDKSLRKEAGDNIVKKPNYYTPPVLYVLSKELFVQGKKEQAAFWFYVAQLRALYDANLSTDSLAMQTVNTLNDTYSLEINNYTVKNMLNLKGTINKVVQFVTTNKEHYDHSWINLLAGTDILIDKKQELSQPPKQWARIKKETIADYYKTFVDHVKSQGM